MLILLSSVLLSLGLAEVAIRLLYGRPLQFRAPQPRYIATGYGYSLEPNQRTFIGEKLLLSNEHGFRDHPWQVSELTDRRRILILGDSMPFGYHVTLEETFGKQLERKLERSAPNLEVLVAAISGWDTRTELEFLRAEGLQLEPELVVLCLYINDFMSGLPFDTPAAAPGDRVETRPRWSRWLSEDVTLQLKRSALIFFVRSRFEWAVAAVYDHLVEPDDRTRSVEARLMANADDPATRSAIEMTHSLVEQMNDLVRARGGDFAIAFMPNYEIFRQQPDSLSFVRELRAFARERGIPFIDPTEDFRAYGDVDDLYLRPWDNAHFSALGHRVVATRMFNELEQRMLRGKHVGMAEHLHYEGSDVE